MRIATNRVQIIGATMHTTTMACCWVEGSVLTTIVDWCGVYRERVPKGIKKKKLSFSLGQWTYMTREFQLHRSSIIAPVCGAGGQHRMGKEREKLKLLEGGLSIRCILPCTQPSYVHTPNYSLDFRCPWGFRILVDLVSIKHHRAFSYIEHLY